MAASHHCNSHARSAAAIVRACHRLSHGSGRNFFHTKERGPSRHKSARSSWKVVDQNGQADVEGRCWPRRESLSWIVSLKAFQHIPFPECLLRILLHVVRRASARGAFYVRAHVDAHLVRGRRALAEETETDEGGGGDAGSFSSPRWLGGEGEVGRGEKGASEGSVLVVVGLHCARRNRRRRARPSWLARSFSSSSPPSSSPPRLSPAATGRRLRPLPD